MTFKNTFLLLLFFILTFLTNVGYAQKSKSKSQKLVFGFYNVENLFDTLDDPKIQDEEFLPSGKNQWTASRYATKLEHLSKVVSNLGSTNGPDILGLCEIENRKVVEDLFSQELLKNINWSIAHFDSRDDRGIDVALVYKADKMKLLSLTRVPFKMVDPDRKTRDILAAELLMSNKDTFFVLVNHWPSRRGGDASEQDRCLMAKQEKHFLDSVFLIRPKVNFVLMGDFNDEPENKSIDVVLDVKHEIQALLPGTLFNPFWNLSVVENLGTYNYQQAWNQLDQIILSENLILGKGKKWKYVPNSAGILSLPWMKETEGKYIGSPYRTFAGAKYLGGYSDHFPVYLTLEFKN